ncbi:oxygenase MpaB family protein [Mycobacterium sp.]|uniref:oxygenase MpaB family protein n=1 Tax=Mycobacterium sp. TaxID=1785 RepID=UPI003D6B963A
MSADTRINITRRTPRWDSYPATVADAMDFWSFAAGAANVVMQLSWPEVGYGVVESKVESGSLMKHPWKRARTTFSYLAVAVLGSPEDQAAFRDAVDVAHREVRSGPDSPVRYSAFDRDLQMWIAACLFVGIEDTYQLLRGKLTDELAEHFYRSAFTLGTTLQVTEDQWPPTRAEFDRYWDSACRRVAIDDAVRGYLQDLINLRMVTPLLRPFVALLRFLTVGFLAPVFREALQVDWTPGQQRRFEYLFLLVSFVNRFLPRFIRQGGSYVLLADVRRRIRRRRKLL